jgi:cytochrome c oxidase subunit 4
VSQEVPPAPPGATEGPCADVPPSSFPSAAATLGTLAALLALTALTTGLAFVEFGPAWHLFTALGIAALKAGLIVAVYMHLAREPRLVRTVALAGLGWLLLLLAGVLAELTTR